MTTPAGRINKLFGTDGGVMLSLYPAFPEAFDTDMPLLVTIDGLEVPLYCERFERRGATGATATFADFDTDRRAQELIGLEFRMDNAFYTDARTADYTFLNFVPYFRYDNSRWDVRLGIPVGIRTCYEHGLGKGDWGANFGSTWWLGLDADASFRFNDSFLLYAGAESGELQMNDFRELEELNPYANLYAGDLVRTYETVDATLGFKASPVSNFWFNVFGGYRILDGDVFVTPGHEDTGDLFFGQNDSRDAYVGAELTYSWRDMYDFSAQGTWHNWNTDTGGEQLLYLKPAVELRLQAGARPVKGLLLNAGYHFISREEVFPAKAANVSNLYVGGSYEPFSHVSIYARLNNLLNKQYEYYQGIPAQGFHFVGGVAFRF